MGRAYKIQVKPGEHYPNWIDIDGGPIYDSEDRVKDVLSSLRRWNESYRYRVVSRPGGEWEVEEF